MDETAKILVVDDEAFIVALIEKILHGTGYQIIKAYDGEEALHKVAATKPDLVILDVNMPKVNGLEVCRRLKSRDETRLIPVVMLTSQDFLEDKISGLEKGADDYITKPFDAKEFTLRIKGLVERRLYQQKKAEDDKLEALERMLESVAHEVRNPIVAIGGFARRIREKLPPDDKLKTYTDHIIREVERLETMLKEIIKLKTIVVSTLESVALDKVIDGAVEEFQRIADEKNIHFVKQYPGHKLLVRCDSRHLTAAFCNLIENAIEAMDRGGTITVAVTLRSQNAVITISDTGRGIPASEIAQVIRPFYTSKMSGSGMGLTVVKHIMTIHGGEIRVASRWGEGTDVTVVLPAQCAAHTAPVQ